MEDLSQYGLIEDGILLDYVSTTNIIEAAEYFNETLKWPDGAILVNLTELLRGI